MKRREQALLLLRKAAQDEALLSGIEVRFRKTHEIGALTALLAQAGCALPELLEDMDRLTPFGAFSRYEDCEVRASLDCVAAREAVRELRIWWKPSSWNGREAGGVGTLTARRRYQFDLAEACVPSKMLFTSGNDRLKVRRQAIDDLGAPAFRLLPLPDVVADLPT